MVDCKCKCKKCKKIIKLLNYKINIIMRYNRYKTTIRNTENTLYEVNKELKMDRRHGIFTDSRAMAKSNKEQKQNENINSSDEEQYLEDKQDTVVSFQ